MPCCQEKWCTAAEPDCGASIPKHLTNSRRGGAHTWNQNMSTMADTSAHESALNQCLMFTWAGGS